MKKIKESLFEKTFNRFLLEIHIKPFIKRNERRKITKNNTVCLFCHPRGGSTWLAELVSSIDRSVYFDEPLLRFPIENTASLPFKNNRKIEAVADLDFYFEQPIPYDSFWPEAEELFENLLAGRSLSLGLYQESGFSKLHDSNLFIVKFNAGHLLMHWLLRHFDVKAIVLVRHPLSTIASQMKMKFAEPHKFVKGIPEFRYDEVFLNYFHIYNKVSSMEEYLAFRWALKIKETLYWRFNDHQKYLILSFESLVENFGHETSRIFKYLHRNVPKNLRTLQNKPSKSTNRQSFERVLLGEQLVNWKGNLSKSQCKKIFRIIDLFDIDIYSPDNVNPDLDNLYGLGTNI